MEENSRFVINIFYLEVERNLMYLIGHVLNRWEAKHLGCTETNQKLADIFNTTSSTIKRDLKKLCKCDYIEVINPGKPGQRVLKPTANLIKTLETKTNDLIKDKRIKFDPLNITSEDQIRPSKEVKSKPREDQKRSSKEVKSRPHNKIINTTINKINNNSLEKDFPFTEEFNSSDQFYEAIKENEVCYSMLKNLWEKNPPTKIDFETALNHWAILNYTKPLDTIDSILYWFKGYIDKKHYLNAETKTSNNKIKTGADLLQELEEEDRLISLKKEQFLKEMEEEDGLRSPKN